MKGSQYMRWAKEHAAARYNLAMLDHGTFEIVDAGVFPQFATA